jgi:hypothetical protein
MLTSPEYIIACVGAFAVGLLVMLRRHRPNTAIPDVGDCVDYGKDSFGKLPGKYRVDGWLRVAVDEPIDTGHAHVDEVLEELRAKWRAEDRAENPPRIRYQWCLPEEATHVSLAGIGGAIAPISEVKITGRIKWPEAHIAEDRERAMTLGTKKEQLF